MIETDSLARPTGVNGEELSPEAYAYYLANKDGFDAWNEYVEKYGLPLVDTLDF